MATRIHFRYVVQDSAGSVIQNAKVFVYQPGTTTDFTGTAFNAKSGGGSIANGFTTNNQGEAEAWFDTPQSVDLKVTDNAGTAFYPATPSSPFAFTSVTEANWDLEPAREDSPTAIATAVPAVPRSVGAAGSSTLFEPGDHIHPIGVGLGRTTQFTPVANLNEQVIHNITVPANTVAAGSVFHVKAKVYWTNSTTAASLTLRLKWGGTGGVLLVTSGTLTGTTTAHTDTPVTFDALVSFRTIGATGTAVGDADGFETITTTAATKTLWSSTITAAVTVDTTASKTLDLTGQIGTSNTGINYKVDNVTLEQVM